ncbi:TMEM175 family protein [Halomonas denitrificans]|nr:DUF1211 domain-containing protein [Halomonas denitrificans]
MSARAAVDGVKLGPDGHPRRGAQMTRLETFTDAAFAFAAALLAISIDEIPGNYQELIEAMKGAPAFIASFAILFLFWRAHQVWSDKFGLEDLRSTLLTAALVVVIMIYVYPLKILFSAGLSTATGGWLPSEFQLDSLHHFRVMVSVYGIGFAAVAGIVAGLYLNAASFADDLAMSAKELYDTRSEALAWFIVGLFGVASFALAWLLDGPWVSVSAWMYNLLIVYGPLFTWLQKRTWQKRVQRGEV